VGGSAGGSSLTVSGTLTNSSTNGSALVIGSASENNTAPDTVTVQGVSGTQGLFNTGQIAIYGSGTGAQATLNIDNASAVAGFGTVGVETGNLLLANNALLEFTSGQITTIDGIVQLQGANAVVADSTNTTANSALTGLTTVAGSLVLQGGASITTTGGPSITGNGVVGSTRTSKAAAMVDRALR
jgi:hypothetical protein